MQAGLVPFRIGGKLLGKIIKLHETCPERTKGLTVVPYDIISDNDDGYLYKCIIIKGQLLNGESIGSNFCSSLDFGGGPMDGWIDDLGNPIERYKVLEYV